MRRSARSTLAATVALVVLAGAVTGEATPPGPTITSLDDSATASAYAAYDTSALGVEVVSFTERGGLTAGLVGPVTNAAMMLGVPAVYGRGFTMGMYRITRGNTVVRQSSGPGWAIPMAMTALDLQTIGDIMGRQVSGPIGQGQVVMSQSSATFHATAVGDRIEFLAANNTIVTFTVGLIAPDVLLGGTEILMSTVTAATVGANTNTRLMLYGKFDHAAVAAVLVSQGLFTTAYLRVSKSWDPPGPDDTLSLMRTKQLLGEFDIYYAGLASGTSAWVARNAAWSTANLPTVKDTYAGGVRALCHNAIRADLTAALSEVLATYPSLVKSNQSKYFTGIDVANTNNNGGCATSSSARLSRIANGTGTVSRHSWGQAIDMSTLANCQGCVPKMDCNIVRIFRKHHFAWGGNFLEPDGMHFEWVGEARNTVQGTVNYCPNPALPPALNAQPPPANSRGTLFADDGWMLDL